MERGLNAIKLVVFTAAYYVLAGVGVVASLYLASHLFLLLGREVKWFLRLIGS